LSVAQFFMKKISNVLSKAILSMAFIGAVLTFDTKIVSGADGAGCAVGPDGKCLPPPSPSPKTKPKCELASLRHCSNVCDGVYGQTCFPSTVCNPSTHRCEKTSP
jgi:hypothetical protein